jgi:hypothetical protein
VVFPQGDDEDGIELLIVGPGLYRGERILTPLQFDIVMAVGARPLAKRQALVSKLVVPRE